MNRQRRKQLVKALAILQAVHDEEQEAFDNMPESIQESERGEGMEDGLNLLVEAIEAIEEIVLPQRR